MEFIKIAVVVNGKTSHFVEIVGDRWEKYLEDSEVYIEDVNSGKRIRLVVVKADK